GNLFVCLCTLQHKDLGSTDGPPRNWKGIGIAMVVILAVMSLVILSVILLTPGKNVDKENVALRTREGHVLSFSLTSNLTTTLLDNSSLVSNRNTKLLENRFQYTQLIISTEAWGQKAALQYASWGPQGNQLAFVFDGDIYYKPSVTSEPLRLTSTDPEQYVVNGLSDWTYEEEVLLQYAAHWWSVDGARLAYLSINNSVTPVMEIPHFLGGLYPSNVLFPYPKAGSSIPSVSLFVVNLYGPAHTLEMMPPDSLRARDNYISMVTWISSTRLAVRWLNRAQNQSVLCVCEATTGACSEDVPLFSADGSVFYTILPAKQGARGEFRHIAGLLAIPSVPPRFLTSGSWDVTMLSTVCGAGANTRQCITCNLIDGCRFYKAVFSPNQTHFTLYCLGKSPTHVHIYTHTGLHCSDRYVVLEDNSRLSKALEDKRLPETLFRTLSISPHLLILFLLFFRDGIPGSQSVTEEFALDWPQVFSSMHNVALARVDGRSGVGRGQKTTAVDPRKLGSMRVKDYLAVIELLMQLPYIDDRRMALYGKAFGGYLTLKMLAATDKLFQCSAAVAPITDFRLYSAAFSERYLGLPAKEEHAYLTASMLEEVNKLKDENFLILHGTADARVHFQHSAELLSRLVKVEANYSLQLYPDEGHILREPRSIKHFQRTVVNYLQTCLKHRPLLDPIADEEEEDD
uniref:Dipeptidyl-peptidase 6b n=1 Tax=Pundamilia nyererei TaxID=303518 RepID=A0A3B4F0W2_9CICH